MQYFPAAQIMAVEAQARHFAAAQPVGSVEAARAKAPLRAVLADFLGRAAFAVAPKPGAVSARRHTTA